MILKLLLVIGVIGAIYFFFIKKKPLKNSPKSKGANKAQEQANDMIECATCGTYAEIDDCILSNNKYYCSRECVDKA